MAGVVAAACLVASPAEAQLIPHDAVDGPSLDKQAVILWIGYAVPTTWSKMGEAVAYRSNSAPRVLIEFDPPSGQEAIELPFCAKTTEVEVGGKWLPIQPGVTVASFGSRYRSSIAVELSRYEAHIACSDAPRVGKRITTVEGLGLFKFPSVHEKEGGGQAVVFIPRGHDLKKPSALLVGLHPWNSGIWTYAAYGELIQEAQAKDVVLLMPSGLGNALYTEHAESEVMTAMDELSRAVAVDPQRVSLWGASMGGAGATTIGFHHPDRFATITSFFGDSKYDLSTYVKAILPTEAAAHRVNALDVADNARNVPVWLVHGEADTVSPIAQSDMLARALKARGFAVRFDRVPGMGHEAALVRKFAAEVVDRAAEARAPVAPRRISFTRVGPYGGSVYGVRFVRSTSPGDATLDLERLGDAVHVYKARGVTTILLPRGAFGFPPSATPPLVVEDRTATQVEVRWDAPP